MILFYIFLPETSSQAVLTACISYFFKRAVVVFLLLLLFRILRLIFTEYYYNNHFYSLIKKKNDYWIKIFIKTLRTPFLENSSQSQEY